MTNWATSIFWSTVLDGVTETVFIEMLKLCVLQLYYYVMGQACAKEGKWSPHQQGNQLLAAN
jgi:hypothetical protein